MKIKNHTKLSRKTKVIFSLVILLVIISSVLFYLEVSKATNFFKNPLSFMSRANDQELEEAIKNDPTTADKSKIPTHTSGVDPNATTDQVPVATGADITITTLEQSKGLVTFKAQSSGIDDNGTCSATFTKETSRPIVRNVAATNNICGPISIPEAEFSQTGSWTLTVRYFANGRQVETTRDIEIQ